MECTTRRKLGQTCNQTVTQNDDKGEMSRQAIDQKDRQASDNRIQAPLRVRATHRRRSEVQTEIQGRHLHKIIVAEHRDEIVAERAESPCSKSKCKYIEMEMGEKKVQETRVQQSQGSQVVEARKVLIADSRSGGKKISSKSQSPVMTPRDNWSTGFAFESTRSNHDQTPNLEMCM